jgi:hypothetical protein
VEDDWDTDDFRRPLDGNADVATRRIAWSFNVLTATYKIDAKGDSIPGLQGSRGRAGTILRDLPAAVQPVTVRGEPKKREL